MEDNLPTTDLSEPAQTGETTPMAANPTTEDTQATNARVENSIAVTVSAKQDAHVENSMVLAVAAGRDLTSENSFEPVVAVGHDLHLQQGGSGFMVVGNQAHVTGSTIGVLLARADVKLDEGSKVLMSTQQALAFGAAFGVAFGLIRALLRRPRRK
jgi:hypothetical protein